MKKTWDNLKVGDKFYKFDLWKNMFDEYSVIDIGLKGYIAFHFVSNPPDIINVMHIDKVKEECSLTQSLKSKTLALIAYKEKTILDCKEHIESYKGYIEETNKKIIKVKEEIKNLKQQLKDESK